MYRNSKKVENVANHDFHHNDDAHSALLCQESLR